MDKVLCLRRVAWVLTQQILQGSSKVKTTTMQRNMYLSPRKVHTYDKLRRISKLG